MHLSYHCGNIKNIIKENGHIENGIQGILKWNTAIDVTKKYLYNTLWSCRIFIQNLKK